MVDASRGMKVSAPARLTVAASPALAWLDVSSRRRYMGPRAPRKSEMFDRITFDPQIMGGRACIRGMRIPVSVVVGEIAYGATIGEVLEDHPDLEREDVEQALRYAAWLTQEEIHSS
jgi:uncharacterized protein (DUF433 family)